MAFSKKPNAGFLKIFFPSEYDSDWSKGHGRLERMRLQRVSLSPEEAGLCGCWQFIAVWRERQILSGGKVVQTSQEYSFYATSLAPQEHSAESLAEIIRGHWAACEISSHYRRDVTLNEDASRISGKKGAHVMATLRNLVLGVFEHQKHQNKTTIQFLPCWQRKMTASQAVKLITKGT